MEYAFTSMKRNKAKGYDDIDGNIIIDVFQEIKWPLYKILKLSFSSGIFPDELIIVQ